MATASIDGLRKSEAARRCDYRLGEPIVFGPTGDAVRHQASGWSHPEGLGTWTDGSRAELWFRIGEPIDCDLVLRAEVAAFVPRDRKAQSIDVAVNDATLANWSFAEADAATIETIVIPTAVAAKRMPVRVRFDVRFPGRDVGSAAFRRLGLQLRSLTLARSAAAERPHAAVAD